jgi:hypothetical protein
VQRRFDNGVAALLQPGPQGRRNGAADTSTDAAARCSRQARRESSLQPDQSPQCELRDFRIARRSVLHRPYRTTAAASQISARSSSTELHVLDRRKPDAPIRVVDSMLPAPLSQPRCHDAKNSLIWTGWRR